VIKRKYYIDKNVQIWVDKKMLKNPTKKKVFFIKGPLGSPKNERVKKT
jgi:hypothetical protein